MKSFFTSISFLMLTLCVHAEHGSCAGCQCTVDSDCPCMQMPECIDQNGTCVPENHCGCLDVTCDCSQCATCSIEEGTCCATGGCCLPQ